MIIKSNDEKIRYTGRWNVTETSATSTANGNYFEFMYSGECAVIGFDMWYTRVPYPHVYISVDDGARIEVSLDRYVRIFAKEGVHKVCVILKGAVEYQHRWNDPMEARVSLLEIEADEFLELPEDNRPVIEFIGDSITEGISIDVGYAHYKNSADMIYWNDSTAGYTWRTAQALDFRPVTMGYGCLGTTVSGAGGIPPAGKSYKYYCNGKEMESIQADYIVINHGTNDRKGDINLFREKYYEFLEIVRERNPKSKIISLTPFAGFLAKEIKEIVEKYNKDKNDSVFYIDSTGWIDPEPVHPTREGHKKVSERLSAIIKEQLM